MIHYATPADVALLLQLSATTFYDAFAAQNTPETMQAYMSEAFTEAKMAAELADPDSTFLLAFVDDEAVGYAKLRRGDSPDAPAGCKSIELQRIYVAQKAIGRKLGQKLLDACLQITREEGYERVWLGVWEHNTSAQAFYRKMVLKYTVPMCFVWAKKTRQTCFCSYQ